MDEREVTMNVRSLNPAVHHKQQASRVNGSSSGQGQEGFLKDWL